VILVVTLNPALDVTHHVAGADWAGVNRPHAVTTRPGGKGANVARTLLRLLDPDPCAERPGAEGPGGEGPRSHTLPTGRSSAGWMSSGQPPSDDRLSDGGLYGSHLRHVRLRTDGPSLDPPSPGSVSLDRRHTGGLSSGYLPPDGAPSERPVVGGAASGDPAVLLIGLAGGAAGDALRTGLVAAGVSADLTEIAAETRRTFAVVDTEHGRTALFNEPGPPVAPAELDRFLVAYRAALTGATAVVLTGSLPTGLRPETYADLVRLAVAAGVPVVLDTDGPALALGAAAGPAIVKPNRAELERAAGRPLAGLADVTSAAAGLAGAGTGAVVVSLGPDGLLAVTGAGTWLAAPPGPADGNPTGAGDAVVAGLTWGLVSGQTWPERLRHAVALGTAAVAAPTAGELSMSRYRALLPQVRLARQDPP
jgi:tagatose 6-phosphate kinase